ncbi:hypothetical protein LINGRAPRIM_LOCUS2343 [Linum grandiflorum]
MRLASIFGPQHLEGHSDD